MMDEATKALGTATLLTEHLGNVENMSVYRLDPPLIGFETVVVYGKTCEEHGPEGAIYAATEDGTPFLLFGTVPVPLHTETADSLDHADILRAEGYEIVTQVGTEGAA